MDGWQEGHSFVEKNFDSLVKTGMMDQSRKQWFLDACKNLYGADTNRQVAFACKNTGFFAMSLMLAAKDLGVDTHPMDGFDIDGVKKEFGIPDNYWIPLIMSVGYFRSDKTLLPAKWRKSCDEIVISFD
jgi:nitroreductase